MPGGATPPPIEDWLLLSILSEQRHADCSSGSLVAWCWHVIKTVHFSMDTCRQRVDIVRKGFHYDL